MKYNILEVKKRLEKIIKSRNDLLTVLITLRLVKDLDEKNINNLIDYFEDMKGII